MGLFLHHLVYVAVYSNTAVEFHVPSFPWESGWAHSPTWASETHGDMKLGCDLGQREYLTAVARSPTGSIVSAKPTQ
jgi:hypothetical protein